MNQINCDSKELRILQQEVEELQNSKKKSTAKGHKDLENEQQEDRQYGFDGTTAEQMHEAGNSLHDFATNIEGFVLEIEDAAKERPALVILGAFALGIIAGRLLFRK